ncbi:MAG: PRC-barrel domain-containing protein [Patescibacteria group bacterium]|nr:PRC-barrel domain-containing protein [Patescibacteria group bacterium]
MFIDAKKIIGNKVFSQSGSYLGRVVDFSVNVLGQNIVKYYVSGDFLALIKKPLIIDASQVIRIRKDKIIVKDAVIFKKAVNEKKTASNIEYAR